MSLSSSALTFLEVLALLLLGLFFFFAGAAFLVFPPRVGLARRFSSACNLAARTASASASGLRFFLGVDATLSGRPSDSIAFLLVVLEGEAEDGGVEGFSIEGRGSSDTCPLATGSNPFVPSVLDAALRLALMMSKRSTISSLIASFMSCQRRRTEAMWAMSCDTF